MAGCDWEGVEMKINFRDVLLWIFLVLTIVLLLWYMFGDSPTEVIIYSVVAGFVLVKMWDFNERLTRVEMGTRNGFGMMKRDMSLVKEDMSLVKENISLVREDVNLIKENMNLIKGRLGV